MSDYAKNTIELCRHQNPAKIKMLFSFQRKDVVEELKNHFGARDLDELAFRLSIGH